MATVRPGLDGNHLMQLPEGPYGVPDKMIHGFQHAQSGNRLVHPLEYSEKHWHDNLLAMDFKMLRNTQGLHAPLKLQMEYSIAGKIKRLPGLQSSNVMENCLSGRDELLEFEDMFDYGDERPLPQVPHILIEKELKIL